MTPRPYLSYSSYSLFKRSKSEWAKKYLLGQKGFVTEAMRFGKQFARIREGVEEAEDELIKSIVTFLPQYPRKEHEITATVKVGGKPLVLYGRLDGADLRKHIIADDKTARTMWTQGQVHSNKQLTWYAYIYYLNKKVIPKIELNCIETDSVSGVTVATGNVKTFYTSRTIRDFIYLQSDINKVWKEIVDFCETEWKGVL